MSRLRGTFILVYRGQTYHQKAAEHRDERRRNEHGPRWPGRFARPNQETNAQPESSTTSPGSELLLLRIADAQQYVTLRK